MSSALASHHTLTPLYRVAVFLQHFPTLRNLPKVLLWKTIHCRQRHSIFKIHRVILHQGPRNLRCFSQMMFAAGHHLLSIAGVKQLHQKTMNRKSYHRKLIHHELRGLCLILAGLDSLTATCCKSSRSTLPLFLMFSNIKDSTEMCIMISTKPKTPSKKICVKY